MEDVAREIFESGEYEAEVTEESIKKYLQKYNYDLFNEIDRSEVEEITKRVTEMFREKLLLMSKVFQKFGRAFQSIEVFKKYEEPIKKLIEQMGIDGE